MLPEIQWLESNFSDKINAPKFGTQPSYRVWPRSSKWCCQNDKCCWQDVMYGNQPGQCSTSWPLATGGGWLLLASLLCFLIQVQLRLVRLCETLIWRQRWFVGSHRAAWRRGRLILYTSFSASLSVILGMVQFDWFFSIMIAVFVFSRKVRCSDNVLEWELVRRLVRYPIQSSFCAL